MSKLILEFHNWSSQIKMLSKRSGVDSLLGKDYFHFTGSLFAKKKKEVLECFFYVPYIYHYKRSNTKEKMQQTNE